MNPFRKTECRAGLLALLLAPLVAGCGYKAGFLIPPRVRSIHVKIVENDTFWRYAAKVDNMNAAAPLATPRPAYPMAVDLTEEVKNEIVRRTPLRLLPESQADSVLAVRIRSVKNRVLTRDGTDDPAVGRADIVVDFVWTNRHNGRVLAQSEGIQRPTTYRVNQAESFTSAAERSYGYLAERIVEAMQERF